MIKHKIIFLLLFVFMISCRGNRNNKSMVSVSDITFPETYIEALDDVLAENSGIILWNNLLWTHNDSGGENQLYGFNKKTGEVEVTIEIANVENIDWEDIAQDDEYIYIAETGNNLGIRTDLKILMLKKSEITREVFQTLSAEIIEFSYASQTDFSLRNLSNPYDCEALIAFNDTLFLFSKDWVTNTTKVFHLPPVPGSYVLEPIDSFDVKGLITGADITADGQLALVGYLDFRSFAWVFQKTGKSFFGNPRYIDLSMLKNAQTEGICFDTDGSLLISCEQTISHPQKMWRIGTDCFK